MGKAVYEDDPEDISSQDTNTGVTSNRDTDTGVDTDVSKMAPANKPVAKPNIVTKEQLAASGLSLRDYMNKQQGLTRRREPAAASSAVSAAPAASTVNDESSKPSTPAPKKEMYRTLGGKMAEKKPDASAADFEKSWVNIKNAASSIGDYISTLGNKEKKSGTYVRNGKVERYAKGGAVKSSASSRGDGIASKGKTRGKIY